MAKDFLEAVYAMFIFFSFDGIIDETDQLVAPRLPRQPGHDNSIETNEIDDAFLFTTTPKPTTLGSGVGSGASPASTEIKFKPGIFDMRKFFFIPKATKHVNNGLSQAERRVHHLHQHHFHHNVPKHNVPKHPPHSGGIRRNPPPDSNRRNPPDSGRFHFRG